jgi:hypothetical protein
VGRDKLKTTDLHLDHAAGIRKLCEGNLKYFYDTYIRGEISSADFYSAMRYMEPITPQVEQTIDEAYFEALIQLALTHDELAEVPSFNGLLALLYRKFDYIESESEVITKEETVRFKQAIRFYQTLLERKLLMFKEKKKSKATL